MNRILLALLSIFLISLLASCSDTVSIGSSEPLSPTSTSIPAEESKSTATSIPVTLTPTPEPEEQETAWPDVLPFCRANPDNPEGEADCWVVKDVDKWLALEPRAGDEFAEAYWPASIPLPPLPEGLEWQKERRLIEEKGGGYINFWVVVPSEFTTSESQTPWPETYFFCRSGMDDNEGKSDCQRVASIEEWQQLDLLVGDELGIWPEGMPVPPLPEGMEWEKVRDPNIGEYYWVVVASE
jgi:hypothetical protein